MKSTADRLRIAMGLVMVVMAVGTVGYWALGFTPLDAAYQTITTITTVGYREVNPFDSELKIFSMFLIVFGVGAVLYTFTLMVQVVVEGQLQELVGRRRMDRQINQLAGHTIVCGFGRVGAAVAHDLHRDGERVVVVDGDADRVRNLPYPTVVGDATRDDTLRAAGVDRARSLIAALETDASNLFVTLSGRDLNPSLFIVARARAEESVAKLEHAGADRVVNPQELGAARMASFVARPHVAEFVDVVMHERSLEFRMQEFEIPEDSPVAGKTLREIDMRQVTGALVLAVRLPDGSFTTNPTGETTLEAKHVAIAVGTDLDLAQLDELVTPKMPR